MAAFNCKQHSIFINSHAHASRLYYHKQQQLIQFRHSWKSKQCERQVKIYDFLFASFLFPFYSGSLTSSACYTSLFSFTWSEKNVDKFPPSNKSPWALVVNLFSFEVPTLTILVDINLRSTLKLLLWSSNDVN